MLSRFSLLLRLLPLLSLFVIACSSSHKTEVATYPQKQPKYSIEMDGEGRKDGKEIWWYATGMKKYQANNVAGIREGMFTSWYPDGVKWYEGFEFHGKPESTLTYWYPNGVMKSQAL